jgi:uncharacterized lipoprotein NlpE involved in copper resistance
MKKTIALLSAATFGLMGCAHHHQYSEYRDRHYVREEPQDTVVVVQDGNRTYVRDYENGRDPDCPCPENIMEPRFRGKAPEAMGWNTESYYRQRGYR